MKVRILLAFGGCLLAIASLAAACGSTDQAVTITVTPASAPPTPDLLTPIVASATAYHGVGTPIPLATLEASAVAFDEFPVLWLGDSYDSNGDGVADMPLRWARPYDSPAFNDPVTGKQLTPAVRAFDVSYGDCEVPPGKTSCPSPISIEFLPPNTGPVSGRLGTVSVRGVNAVVYGYGSLSIETADFTVTISVFSTSNGDRLQKAIDVANELYGANSKAAGITRSSDFRPPPPATPAPFPTDPPRPPTRTPTPFPIVTPAPTDAPPTVDVSTAVAAPAP